MTEQATLGKRARNRLARHSDYLATALRIATEDGLDALTMQRLAAEVDAAIGTVYTYFPSKGALLAEVQREAIDRLIASYAMLRADVDARVADADPAVATVTHLVAFARFNGCQTVRLDDLRPANLKAPLRRALADANDD